MPDNLYLGDSRTLLLLCRPVVEVCDNLFITSTVPLTGGEERAA